MGWITRNIEEIERDRALRFYGIALALANVVTFLYWKIDFPLLEVLKSYEPPICWPFFENCHVVRVFSDRLLDALLWGYLAVSLAAVAAFASPRFARVGYWILLALLFYRGFFLFQDYRLRLNQHYMMYWTMLAFLLVPGKRVALRYLVVLFYFWAGIIKLNPEWFSGAALYGQKPWLVPESLIPASCVYVVVLEIALIFGVFSKRRWLFWGTLAQLALFHLTSFTIVGFYYPLLMYAILSIFVLERYVLPPQQLEVPETNALDRKIAMGVLLAGFFSVQFIPHAYPGDSALTGEGRFFALHMFDAPIECQAMAVLRPEGGKPRRMPLQVPHMPGRIHCDPIVFWSIARHICRSNEANPNFPKMGVHMRARRVGESRWHRMMKIPDFCAMRPGYTIFGHNEWISSDTARSEAADLKEDEEPETRAAPATPPTTQTNEPASALEAATPR